MRAAGTAAPGPAFAPACGGADSEGSTGGGSPDASEGDAGGEGGDVGATGDDSAVDDDASGPVDEDAAIVLAALARARGVPVHEPVTGQRATVGGLVVHVLGPHRGAPYAGSDAEVNEMSLVLRVDQGTRRALLTGDAEGEAQADLLATPATLRAGLLKVPHHGSATT